MHRLDAELFVHSLNAVVFLHIFEADVFMSGDDIFMYTLDAEIRV